MKAMKELQGLSNEELERRLQELRKELMKENTAVASATNPANPGRLKQMKKNIARIKTIKRKSKVFGIDLKSDKGKKEVK